MTLIELIPPIALATVLNIWAFYFAWKWTKVEERAGEPPWQLILLGLIYLGSLSAFMILHGFEKPMTGYFPIVFAALISQCIGGFFVWVALKELFTIREQPIGQKIRIVVGTIAISTVIFLPLIVD